MQFDNGAQQLPRQIWMKAADVANQRQPRGKQGVFIFFIIIFFFSFWSRLYSSVKQISSERLKQSAVHLPKFLIFTFSWLQSRRKNLNFHAGKTLSHCHNHCFVLLFFSNLNWFTMPPLMTDSLLIFFCAFLCFQGFHKTRVKRSADSCCLF